MKFPSPFLLGQIEVPNWIFRAITSPYSEFDLLFGFFHPGPYVSVSDTFGTREPRNNMTVYALQSTSLVPKSVPVLAARPKNIVHIGCYF